MAKRKRSDSAEPDDFDFDPMDLPDLKVLYIEDKYTREGCPVEDGETLDPISQVDLVDNQVIRLRRWVSDQKERRGGHYEVVCYDVDSLVRSMTRDGPRDPLSRIEFTEPQLLQIRNKYNEATGNFFFPWEGTIQINSISGTRTAITLAIQQSQIEQLEQDFQEEDIQNIGEEEWKAELEWLEEKKANIQQERKHFEENEQKFREEDEQRVRDQEERKRREEEHKEQTDRRNLTLDNTPGNTLQERLTNFIRNQQMRMDPSECPGIELVLTAANTAPWENEAVNDLLDLCHNYWSDKNGERVFEVLQSPAFAELYRTNSRMRSQLLNLVGTATVPTYQITLFLDDWKDIVMQLPSEDTYRKYEELFEEISDVSFDAGIAIPDIGLHEIVKMIREIREKREGEEKREKEEKSSHFSE